MAVNIKKEFGASRQRKPDLTSLVYGKIPPQAIEVEQALLGAILLESWCLSEALDLIHTGEVFYNNSHQIIYDAILTLNAKGSAVDLPILTNELRKQGKLEEVGGAYFLTKLTMDVRSSANVESHARIVLEKYIMRELIRISGIAITSAYEDSKDVFDLLDEAEQSLQSIHHTIEGSGNNTVFSAAQSGMIVLKSIYEMQGHSGELTGIPSGIPDLDTLTSGWRKTDLTIIAGRPGQGKTALALNLMLAAARQGFPVLFLSQEMSHEQLTERMYANMATVDFGHIRNKQLTADELAKVERAQKEYASLKIIIDEKAAIPIHALRRIIKKWKQKEDIKLVIVDYLQLLIVAGVKVGNLVEATGMKSQILKALAKEFSLPIIALCQMSRSIEARKGTPQLSDLRDSGSIEQDADNVFFIHHENGTQLICAKQRSGQTGVVPVKFVGKYQRFTDLQDFPQEEHFKPFAGMTKNFYEKQDEPF